MLRLLNTLRKVFMMIRKWMLGGLLVASTGAFCVAVDPPNRGDGKSDTSRLDSKTSSGTIRASKLIGMKLVNRANENVGSISDLVIDPNVGQVKYVAVSFGGFLGLGDKWFAVPIEAIKAELAKNSTSQYVMVLDVSKEQMKDAVGFDENNWPDFSDSQMTDGLYRRFNVERRTHPHDGHVDVNVEKGGVNVEINRKK
jgi:sporulation protein YlmC with PRC-barrel domain